MWATFPLRAITAFACWALLLYQEKPDTTNYLKQVNYIGIKFGDFYIRSEKKKIKQDELCLEIFIIRALITSFSEQVYFTEII